MQGNYQALPIVKRRFENRNDLFIGLALAFLSSDLPSAWRKPMSSRDPSSRGLLLPTHQMGFVGFLRGDDQDVTDRGHMLSICVILSHFCAGPVHVTY